MPKSAGRWQSVSQRIRQQSGTTRRLICLGVRNEALTVPPLPQNPDIMGTVTVGSDRQKPTSHASALRNWGFLPGAAEVGFFRSYPDRTPHDSRGRNWGRSELNRESDTPKGTGQLPACELVGWLKIEAQGCTEGPTAVHIRSTRKGVKPNPSFLSMGKGGFRVNLMNWSVSMTFRKVLCPHCRGKLEPGQRYHLGLFATEAEAYAAYVAKKREIHEGCTL